MVRGLPFLLVLPGCLSLSRVNGAKPLEKGQYEFGMAGGLRTQDDPLLALLPIPQGPFTFRLGLGNDLDLGLRGYIFGTGLDVRYRFLQTGRWHFAVNPGFGFVAFPNLFNPSQIGTIEANLPLVAEIDATRWLSASFGTSLIYREYFSLAPNGSVARFDAYTTLGARLEARGGLMVYGASIDGVFVPTRYTGVPGLSVGLDIKIRTRSAEERARRKAKQAAYRD